MKKLFILLLLLVSVHLRAQQNAQYTNFLFNAFALNPANAGLKECLDTRLGYRTQWVGMDANPRTVSVTAHQRIKAISSDRGAIHGAGIVIEADNTGPTSRTKLGLAYAIHLPLSRKMRLAFGLGLGAFQYRFDASQIFVPNPNDPVINQSQSEFVFPDIQAGAWLYTKNWFVGFAGDHLTNPTLNDIGTDVQIKPNFNLMMGRIYKGGDKMSYIPAALFKFVGNSKPALDVNFWADYDNRVALGLGFRSEDAVSGMMKFNFLDYFTLAYAYDFTYSRVRYGSANTHEIILGVTACPRNERVGFVPCAAYN